MDGLIWMALGIFMIVGAAAVFGTGMWLLHIKKREMNCYLTEIYGEGDWNEMSKLPL